MRSSAVRNAPSRNEKQLLRNRGAVGWRLSPEQIAALEGASQRAPVYPYWQQRDFEARNTLPTQWQVRAGRAWIRLARCAGH
jgi:hypothetical protein